MYELYQQNLVVYNYINQLISTVFDILVITQIDQAYICEIYSIDR